MITAFVILWFLLGLLGCWLADSVTLAHPEDTDMSGYQSPSDVFFAIAGPGMLLCWVIIAVGYALGVYEKEDHDQA